jgi:hypothetical protein
MDGGAHSANPLHVKDAVGVAKVDAVALQRLVTSRRARSHDCAAPRSGNEREMQPRLRSVRVGRTPCRQLRRQLVEERAVGDTASERGPR